MVGATLNPLMFPIIDGRYVETKCETVCDFRPENAPLRPAARGLDQLEVATWKREFNLPLGRGRSTKSSRVRGFDEMEMVTLENDLPDAHLIPRSNSEITQGGLFSVWYKRYASIVLPFFRGVIDPELVGEWCRERGRCSRDTCLESYHPV